MSLFEDTNPRALKELLGEVHSLTMALPDFQRDFVWDPGATQELIISIANNYPAGSILRVRDTKRIFAAREFEGAPKIHEHKHTYLVLDGQQRLTSLYQAFYGVGDHRYYIDLKKLLKGLDFEDAIFHMRANTKWVKEHEDFALQASELIMPLNLLKAGDAGFLKWLLRVTNPLTPEDRLKMQAALQEVNDHWICTIDDYHFPVVTLSDTTEPDALCTIFETLNRTGVKLSVFELLTARFWPRNVNLRNLWDESRIKHPIIDEYEVDPYYILQSVALACRKTPSCKRSDVLNLEAKDISEWWDKVVEGLCLGMEILRDDCKVLSPKWVPYQTMISPLAAVLARVGVSKTPLAGLQREKLKKWFWCAVFSQAYESAANTQSVNDFTGLMTWLSGGAEPETVRSIRFDPASLINVTPRQRAVYRGIICLILASSSGTRDFHTQAVITNKLMNAEGIDDHHIFPDSYLDKKKGIKTSSKRNTILNRTLIDRTTNQMISDRAPSDYLKEIKSVPGFPLDDVLNSHLLPTGDSSPLWSDDYETFLTWRQNKLWNEIKRVTGIQEGSNLQI